MPFPHNPDKFGGTEYMARKVNRHILPMLPKFEDYRLLVLPGAMPTEWEPGKPTIMWLHNTLDQLPPEAGALFRDPAFLGDLRWLIVVSEWHRQAMIATTNVDPLQIVVIPNASEMVDTDLKRFSERVDRPILIHASRQHRGMEVLIPAAHMVPDDFELWVFNDFNPDSVDLPDEIAEIVLDPRIVYFGDTPRDTVAQHMARAHIHAYPAYWQETSCLVQIEAMRAGLLSVTSQVAALPETGMGHSMVVPLNGPDDRDGDIQAFAYSLSEAIGIVNNGLWVPKTQVEDAHEQYSWFRAVDRWTELHGRL